MFDIHIRSEEGSDSESAIGLSFDDLRSLLGLLVYVPDKVLREPDNDALLRRLGAAMGRPC